MPKPFIATHVFLLLIIVGLAFRARADVRDVIITTDCGTDIDDQWTLVHAALSKRVNLLAVYGDFAPNAHDTVACAQRALAVAGRPDLPVYQGATTPIAEAINALRNDAVDHLIRTAHHYSPTHRLTVLGLGPASDLAMALRIEPDLTNRIDYYALAFEAYPEGGDGWNVSNDVQAWQTVLDSDLPIHVVMGPLAGSRLKLFRESDGQTVFVDGSRHQPLFTRTNEITQYLSSIFTDYVSANWKLFNGEMGEGTQWPIWDEAVLGTILGYTHEEKVPRPILDSDLSFRIPGVGQPAPFWITDQVDREALIDDLVRTVSR